MIQGQNHLSVAQVKMELLCMTKKKKKSVSLCYISCASPAFDSFHLVLCKANSL